MATVDKGPSGETAWSAQDCGIFLWIRLTPKGGRDALEGLDALADGRAVLKARVRAAPEDGRANAALIELLAKALATPRAQIEIVTGQSARVKKLFIAGDPARLEQALEKASYRKNG